MKKIISLVFIFAFAFALAGQSEAHAVSSFDNNYRTVNSLHYGDTFGGITCSDVQYEQDDINAFIENSYYWRSGYFSQNIVDDYNTALASGTVYYSQVTDTRYIDGNEFSFIRISFSTTPLNLTFSGNNVITDTTGLQKIQFATIHSRTGANNCGLEIWSGYNGYENIISNKIGTTNDFSFENYLSIGINSITYPENYEGDNIKETITLPATNLIYQPIIEVTGSQENFTAKYKGKALDPNTSGFPDMTSIRYLITDKNSPDPTSPIGTEIICPITELSLTATYSYSEHCQGGYFDKIDGNKMYALVSGFYIAGNAGQTGYVFNEVTYNITYKMVSIDLNMTENLYTINTSTCDNGTIDGMGGYATNCSNLNSTAQDYLNACFSEEFPFIDINSCTRTFGSVLSLLTFNQINFVGSFDDFGSNCTQLSILDNWLNLPQDYELCPAFSSEVRNTITPFMSFLLGLVAIRFLTNKENEVN